MIEIIYREDENSGEEISVKLPKNIRQVGDTKGTKKVYFEELVMEVIKEKSRYGVLLGKAKRVGNASYLFVNGAVIAVNDGKNIEFNDRVWTGIYEQIHDYFGEAEIVGWFVSENNKKISLDAVKKIQLDNFPGNERICILNDISENEEQLYYYNNGIMEKIQGYYIYFEKNPHFEKYLVKNRALEELFEEEEEQAESIHRNEEPEHVIAEGKKQEEEKEKNNGFSWKGMVPSYAVVALLLAAIVVMNNYGQLNNIKNSLAGIAGQLIQNPSTEKRGEDIQPVVEELPGQVDTTPEQTDTTPEQTDTTPEKKEDPTSSKKEDPTTKKEEQTKPKETEPEETTKKKEPDSEKPADIEPVPEVRYYTVKAGETLSDISRKIYDDLTMVDKIKERNGIKDADMILEGQKIILP